MALSSKNPALPNVILLKFFSTPVYCSVLKQMENGFSLSLRGGQSSLERGQQRPKGKGSPKKQKLRQKHPLLHAHVKRQYPSTPSKVFAI